MAKGKEELYREDLMIYTVPKEDGFVHYIIEKAPYESEGLKKSVHVYGRPGYDAVFKYREDAERALNQFPARPVEEPETAAPEEAPEPAAETADAAET